MKKWLMAWIALGLLLLSACASGQGGKDSNHPYAWKEKRDGSIQFTIQGEPEQGFDWVVEGVEDGIIQVERIDGSKKDKTEFTITNPGLGSGSISFVCQRESEPYDQSFAVTMMLQTDKKEKLKVIQSDYTQTPANEFAGEGEPISYLWYTDENGDFAIYLKKNTEERYSWDITGYDDTIISLNATQNDQTGFTVSATGLKAGQTELMLHDIEQAYAIRLQLTVGEDKTISVTDHESGPYQIPMDQVPGMKEVKALVGDFTLPTNSRVISCLTSNWNNEENKPYGEIVFMIEETGWFCIISKDLSPEGIAQVYQDAEAATTQTTVSDCAVTLYSAPEWQQAIWQDKQGRSFLLSSDENAVQEDLLNIIQSMMGANS